jgi:hypothetical protein
MKWLSAFLIASVLPGCVTSQGVARERAAHDFACPEAEVEISKIAGSSYDAKGCGKQAVYNCAAGNTVVCVPESAPAQR